MLLISLKRIPKSEQHSHAHRLLREALRPLGIAYCGDGGLAIGEHGKPYLADNPDVRFNLSHSDGIAACIVDCAECGIDCERIGEVREGVMRRAFSVRERQLVESAGSEDMRREMFFRIWTLKEAYIKALGTGLSYPLCSAEFIIRDSVLMEAPDGCDFRQYLIKGEYVAAVCILR